MLLNGKLFPPELCVYSRGCMYVHMGWGQSSTQGVLFFWNNLSWILRQDLSLGPGPCQLGLAGWPGSFRVSPVFPSPELGRWAHISIPTFWHECWVSHPGPHACAKSTLANEFIFPAPGWIFHLFGKSRVGTTLKSSIQTTPSKSTWRNPLFFKSRQRYHKMLRSFQSCVIKVRL